MVDISLHEAGFANTLFPKHNHFGIHTHGAHSTHGTRKGEGIMLGGAGRGEGDYRILVCCKYFKRKKEAGDRMMSFTQRFATIAGMLLQF